MTVLARLSEHTEFTALDRLLAAAAIDARKGIVGALSGDEIQDAVNEVLRLGAGRPRSCFHAGFCDALFGREPGREMRAEDAEGRRWYWAGAVLGWARSESWERIAEAYDGDRTVRRLGDGADTASRVAVEHIVRALHHGRRVAELPVFVEEPAIVESTPTLGLYRLLLDIGTESQRAGDADVARAVLDLLMRAEDGLRARGFPPNETLFLEARRRKAHCLRQLRDHHAARGLLLGLLELDPDPNIRAMVQADLGLLEGRYTLLADIQLPDSPGDEQSDLRDRLTAGETHFRAATEREVEYAAHGHYALGVLALVDEGYEDAAAALDRARTCFRSRPRSYPDALIAHTDLYLGIARVRMLEAGDLHQGAALIEAGLRDGARFPTYLIGSTVEALALNDTCIAAVAEPLLATEEDAALDALADTTALTVVPDVADRLHTRAARPDRGGEAKAADLRAALSGYLRTGRNETTGEILDRLEILATREGIGGEAFVELLLEPGRYDPAWDLEDAEIAIAGYRASQGRFLDAMTALRGPFFRYMTAAANGDELAFANATGILEAIRCYGLVSAQYQDMTGRHAAVSRQWGWVEHEPPSVHGTQERKGVDVLVVGGNEKQAKITERVRRLVQERDEFVSVRFVPTGWSSNWRPYANEIARHMTAHQAQALVIMRFMRTHLGRRIRSDCGKHGIPWRHCWGGGREEIANSVLRAADAARAVWP